jgi:hypothetical protein
MDYAVQYLPYYTMIQNMKVVKECYFSDMLCCHNFICQWTHLFLTQKEREREKTREKKENYSETLQLMHTVNSFSVSMNNPSLPKDDVESPSMRNHKHIQIPTSGSDKYPVTCCRMCLKRTSKGKQGFWALCMFLCILMAGIIPSKSTKCNVKL